MDNTTQNEDVASPVQEANGKNEVEGQGEKMVIKDYSNSDVSYQHHGITAGLRKLIQQLAKPGEVTPKEKHRRRSANKRSRISRKRNQKLARLKKGKKK